MTTGSDPRVRDFTVACDWCGTVLVGQIRREQVGQMVLLHVPHTGPDGRPCKGSGRGIPEWPLRLELRFVAGGSFELRVEDGRAIACVSPEVLVAKLCGFGVDPEEARRQVAVVEGGETVVVEVPERRKLPRGRGEGGA